MYSMTSSLYLFWFVRYGAVNKSHVKCIYMYMKGPSTKNESTKIERNVQQDFDRMNCQESTKRKW